MPRRRLGSEDIDEAVSAPVTEEGPAESEAASASIALPVLLVSAVFVLGAVPMAVSRRRASRPE